MMRTVEVLLVIIIITGAFIIASFFAVLPSPRQVSPVNLRRLALTTLQALDQEHDLSEAAFDTDNATLWSRLQIALSASLPPNAIYNLTVFEVGGGGTELYTPLRSVSNAENLGVASDSSSYLVASSNVTFNVIPEKIGERGGGGTLYILNCSDANGWWITGYTAQSLAEDLYKLLSPYFVSTVMVQNTTQLERVLNKTALQGETVQNAVVINTCGEAVPMPAGYYASTGVGYDSVHSSYARYCYVLGLRVRQYNWTWVSIVGYPLYYVGNAALFPNEQNSWGIYGMRQVGPAGMNGFLQGLNNEQYTYDNTWITGDSDSDSRLASVHLTPEAVYYCNYYGIYPSPYHTATRALPSSILSRYNLTVTSYVFEQVGTWIASAVFRHGVSGSFLALGLTRTPDIRLTALSLLCDFKPRLYRSDYTAFGTSRLVVLQLGLVGGV